MLGEEEGRRGTPSVLGPQPAPPIPWFLATLPLLKAMGPAGTFRLACSPWGRGVCLLPGAQVPAPGTCRSHAAHTVLPAVAASTDHACLHPRLVTAHVVPGGAGLTALGVPAKQPGGL